MSNKYRTARVAYEMSGLFVTFFTLFIALFIAVFTICDIMMVTHDPVTPIVTAGEPTITYHPPVERDGARIYAVILE